MEWLSIRRGRSVGCLRAILIDVDPGWIPLRSLRRFAPLRMTGKTALYLLPSSHPRTAGLVSVRFKPIQNDSRGALAHCFEGCLVNRAARDTILAWNGLSRITKENDASSRFTPLE